MDTSEIIIALIFTIGFGYILYLILRDPILMFKSLLRGIKADGNFRVKVFFSPIWIPIWLIDRLFKLKLYIKNFEDASIPKDIKFEEYDKYIEVDTDDSDYIEEIINSFQQSYDPDDYNHTLNKAEIKLSQQDDSILLEIEQEIDLNSFSALIAFIDNSAPRNRVYHVKGILMNKQNRADSYFCFIDSAYPLKLIGKTYRNKKMYVDFDPDQKHNERIYFNSNIEYFKNFKFDKFESDLIRLKFRNIKIKPKPQHAV